MKYIGVAKRKDKGGRNFFSIRFTYKNVRHEFGRYEDARECAKAYDLFVIKKQMDRKTNFFKKIL